MKINANPHRVYIERRVRYYVSEGIAFARVRLARHRPEAPALVWIMASRDGNLYVHACSYHVTHVERDDALRAVDHDRIMALDPEHDEDDLGTGDWAHLYGTDGGGQC